MARFLNFYSLEKVKIRVEKGKKSGMLFLTGAMSYLSGKNILGLGPL